MTVSAVIVYYDTPGHVGEALASLGAQDEPPTETVVIDNSSHDAGARPPIPLGAGVRWEISGRNIGFAAACNRGASITASEYVLFLNPDVRLDGSALHMLIRRLEADPRAAIASPRITGRDGEVELSARRFPTPWTGVLGRTSLLTRVLSRFGRVPPALATAHATQASVVDWVSGACMLVRRRAFDQVGGFDEGYWMYWEDADLCRRLASAGWRIWFEPAATAHHDTGSSGQSEKTVRAFHASAVRYFTLHESGRRVSPRVARAVLTARAALLIRRLRAQQRVRGATSVQDQAGRA
jgi:GT2 family glycosyltransferase